MEIIGGDAALLQASAANNPRATTVLAARRSEYRAQRPSFWPHTWVTQPLQAAAPAEFKDIAAFVAGASFAVSSVVLSRVRRSRQQRRVVRLAQAGDEEAARSPAAEQNGFEDWRDQGYPLPLPGFAGGSSPAENGDTFFHVREFLGGQEGELRAENEKLHARTQQAEEEKIHLQEALTQRESDLQHERSVVNNLLEEKNSIKERSDQAQMIYERVMDELERTQDERDYAQGMAEKAKDLQEKLDKSEKELQRLHAAMAEKDEVIRQREGTIKAKEEQITENINLLKEKDEQIKMYAAQEESLKKDSPGVRSVVRVASVSHSSVILCRSEAIDADPTRANPKDQERQ
eukprot:TRINITY_DN32061_c0_g1_i1.p1 TRINITY_DN32061_c0_g1~~TRINITY_DN32061_c0_g1_i1.p1  ORF type:complete len:347 (-),score=76.65 TRINITY_DN32061_c0_g1_i1:8-1048(-)